ncbi:hypothetical protein H7Y21_03395 [Arenimonas sp.]|nr:hypothetical protein [Candidatus Parcubacteria bacterium]
MLNTKSYASELILYSQDGFDIKTDSFIQDAAGYISLVKNSNLNITFANDKDYSLEKDEPVVDLKIYKKDTKDVVFILQTPTNRVTAGPTLEFEKFFKENKLYFENVSLVNKNVKINIPLKFSGGKYDMVLNLNNKSVKKTLNYSFTVTNFSYKFTTSDILIEDTNILAHIGYTSLQNTEQTNKVVVTLTQVGKEIYKKEFDQKFYNEGNILIDEKINVLSGLQGEAVLKIEIKDGEGSVILTQSKSVSLLKNNGGNKILYYIILGILLILLIILYIIFKNKKVRTLVLLLGLVLLSAGSLVFTKIVDAQTCGGDTGVLCCQSANRPANVCDQTTEYQVKKYVCEKTEKCATTDVRVKKYFSTGKILNTDKLSQIKVNVCDNIQDKLLPGDKFYVISDTTGSNWARMRYHIFTFTKTINGSDVTITFDPGGDKKVVSRAVYNGDCGVTVSATYEGDNTDFPSHVNTVIEAGKVTSDMCKSRAVTTSVFEENGNLMDKRTCDNVDNGGLRNTYIAGSRYIDPIYNTNSYWSDKTVNICNLLKVQYSDVKYKKFYTLMEQTESWTMIRFPVWQFTFGIPFDREAYAKAKPLLYPAFIKKYGYYYSAYKEDTGEVIYDGNCNITFKLWRRGPDTDSNSTTFKMIELGMVDDATCRDPLLTAQDSYKIDGRGLDPYEVEHKTKNDADGTGPITEGKYYYTAPFFYNLKTCRASSQCNLNDSWLQVATNNTCPPLATTTPVLATTTPQTSCSCNGGRSYQCTGSATSTTPNAVDCALGSTCVVATTTTTTTFTVSPINAIGNIIYTNTPDSTSPKTLPKTSSYTYSIPKTDSNQSISVILKDTDDATVNRICSIDNGTTTAPPTTTPVIGECSTVDKNVCLRGTTLATNPIPSSDSSRYYWTCDGTGGGVSKSCSLDKTTTTPPPIINLTKDPKVTLNRGGKCTLSWEIQNIPAGGTCVLTGWGINASGQNVTNTSSSTTIFDLRTNQKYVLTCSNLGQPIPTISKSVICRINPNIIEN